MFKKTGDGGCEEAEGGEKRDEAKVRELARLLEAVHRLVNSKDDLGLAGGIGFEEGKDIYRQKCTSNSNCMSGYYRFIG